ncbi:DUF6221 family protein [Streptomyces olivaceus]|uniref:DUF6221 family protein n=1 Tax=Streptomyces olivaceus TaxID=47716 RepID=UPI003628DAB7
MQDLVQWLRAQLDEEGPHIPDPHAEKSWHARDCASLPDAFGSVTFTCDCGVPARVSREIAAKHQLLDLHGLVHRDLIWVDENSEERTAEIPVCGHCVPRHSSFPHPSAVPQGPCTTLRLLALPYADRPGYRPDWRP